MAALGGAAQNAESNKHLVHGFPTVGYCAAAGPGFVFFFCLCSMPLNGWLLSLGDMMQYRESPISMKPDFAVVVPEKICRLYSFTETEAEIRSGGGGGGGGGKACYGGFKY